MTLWQLAKNFEEFQTTRKYGGYSTFGLFNVETGFASARSTWIAPCSSCRGESLHSISGSCSACGKTSDNSIDFQSGDGDGIYTVVTVGSNTGKTVATICMFDDGSQMAQSLVEGLRLDAYSDFDPFRFIFKSDLIMTEVGQLRNTGKVIFCDSAGGLGNPFANLTVGDWSSNQINAYLGLELSVESPTALAAIALGSSPEDFDGGHEDSWRPRMLLLVSSDYKYLAESIVDFQLSPLQWSAQTQAWKNQKVVGHIEDQGSTAMFWNARLQEEFAMRALERGMEPFEYLVAAFSWYFQGAAIGSEACANELVRVTLESDGAFGSEDFAAIAQELRGMS